MPPRQPNVDQQEFVDLPFTLPAAIAATTTCALFTAPRGLRIDSIELISDANYTQDAANYYSIAFKAAARTVGTWSTQTAAQGTITGGTPAAVPLAAESGQNRVAAAGEVVSVVLTKNAAAANITLRAVLHARVVG